MKPAPFSRSRAIFAAIAAAVAQGMSFAAAASKAGADSYRSRGKGKNKSVGKRRYSRGNDYPFSSTKQHDKCVHRQHMVVVNGFPLMQTRSTYDAWMVAAGLRNIE